LNSSSILVPTYDFSYIGTSLSWRALILELVRGKKVGYSSSSIARVGYCIFFSESNFFSGACIKRIWLRGLAPLKSKHMCVVHDLMAWWRVRIILVHLFVKWHSAQIYPCRQRYFFSFIDHLKLGMLVLIWRMLLFVPIPSVCKRIFYWTVHDPVCIMWGCRKSE